MQLVKLSDLKPPAANPRSVMNEQTLEGLAASIRNDGLLQNLVVKPIKGKSKSYRIISGQRRFRALQLLQERGTIDGDYEVPVEIRTNLSKDDTLRLATVENLQRENMPPLDEAKALAKLIKGGERLGDIVASTGLSASTIRRRVALNNLCDEAQEALRQGAISLAQAEGLTLGDHDRQRDILDDIKRGYGPYSGEDIRERLLDERPNVAMAVFPLDQYKGTITKDLFADEEQSYFDDAEQFFALQEQAVANLAVTYGERFDWVKLTEDYRIPDWQYEEAIDGEESGVLINFSPSGRVDIREGLARPKADEDTRKEAAAHPAVARPKATYSAPVRRYLAWHKSLAVQEVMLSDPRKAREVAAVASLSNFRAHQALPGMARSPEPGSACAVLEQQARVAALSLGFDIDDNEPFWPQFPPCDCEDEELYAALKSLSDHDLDQLHVLLAALSFGQFHCDTLDTEQSLFNLVAQDLNVDMRNHWRVDRTFFERRTRDQLLSICRESGVSDAYGIGMLGTFKKSELVGCMLRHFGNAHATSKPNAAQKKARDWLPEVMEFPAVDPCRAEALAEAGDVPEAEENEDGGDFPEDAAPWEDGAGEEALAEAA
jgi:ParB family chromosome partitioning protein